MMRAIRTHTLFSMILVIGGWQPVLYAADLPAVLDWGQRVELGTLVSGPVSEIPVRVGQRVARGDVLLRLDPRGFRARLAKAEAVVARAQVRFDEARREDERAIELYDRTVLSDHDRQLAAIALEEAKSDLQAAKAQRTQAALDQERSAIRAPFDGLVVRVDAAPGQVIVSQLQSRPLVVLADDRRMQAVASVPAEHIERFSGVSATTVQIRGTVLPGGVPSIDLEPLSEGGATVRYAMRVPVVVGPELRLRSGESVTIQIPD